jgi:hypothetical protein
MCNHCLTLIVTFLEPIVGAFIVDAVDYLDKEKDADSASHAGTLQNSLKTKLIITSDCMDQSFMSSMLRYADYTLVLCPAAEVMKSSMQIGMMNNGSSSSDLSRVDDGERSMKMIVKRKVNLNGVREEIIFSKIKLSDGKLLCCT